MAQQRNPYSTEEFALGEDLWNPQAPKMDPNNPNGVYTAPPPMAPVVQAGPSNPFGGDLAAQTQQQLSDFRQQAAAMGIKIDEGDQEAYRQMQEGLPSGRPSGNTPASGDPFTQSIKNSLQGLFQSGGGFNQDIVNRRTDVARDTLERQRKSRLATNEAALASRGLLGAPGAPSGVEGSSLRRLDTDIADQFSNAYSGIFADESENADQRMIQALQIGAGMSAEEANNALNWFKARNDFTLGSGNLALGNLNAVNSYNLGLGRLGLDRDRTLAELENADIDQIIRLLEQLYGGAQGAAKGFV